MPTPAHSPTTSDAVAGVDVGGTFTDAVVITPAGPRVGKVPTTPRDQGEGLLAAIDAASTSRPRALAHGTTTATNALLERRLDRAALVLTQGFGDVLTIARQNRPSLYDLTKVRPEPAIPRDRVVTVSERVGPDGAVLIPLTDVALKGLVADLIALGPDSVAICLLFSWANPDHEQRIADAVSAAMPEAHLTVSADLVGSIREYERASTCALNAAIGPTMSRYLTHLGERLPDTAISVMTSGGGTADVDRMVAEPVHTLLSGPAAGVVAAADVARSAGFADAIAFDMGGTSTDVCLIRGGRPVVNVEGVIDGLPIGTPTIGIHTVGAGGGSIATLDGGGALQVGPRSAGSEPGPACYGKGGTEPTVTDAHAVLGHLADLAGGTLTPDVDAAAAAFQRRPGVTPTGVLQVVRASMARALRKVSTEAGVDPVGLALVAYGGAGPLHASALARTLGCRAAVLPPAPGVLSAVGLLTAPGRREWSRTVLTDPGGLSAALRALAADVEGDAGPFEHVADMRYAGQAHELRVPLEQDMPPADATTRFHDLHRETYGYALDDADVRVVTVRVVARSRPLHAGQPIGWDLGRATPPSTRTADLGRGPEAIAVLARGAMAPGDVVTGPAIITQPDSTAVLLPGDRGTVDDHHNLVITAEDTQ